ncbi:porin [Mycoplana rhizolycopersici]|uniref:Porin n=1 Tax=Mycoplana rhizolycopersici TaxID=2746702 RepID=A0ABX2Q964_9HYPH|nr:porin [Rhizobium rhizolycopersici]NVP54265.1 porin [Rhizobium rhizolycopersici]
MKTPLAAFAALLFSTCVAHAADAAVTAAPEPASYVRVCDAFGTGYFYIPGTETCLKVGGYLRVEAAGGDPNGQDTFLGGGGDSWSTRSRLALRLSSATDTEYGALSTYSEAEIQNDDNGPTSINIENAYLELGGLRVGYSDTLYTEFTGDAGNTINDYYDVNYGDFGRTQFRYTYGGETGFSFALSAEDDSDPDGGQDNSVVADAAKPDDNYMPDLVAALGYAADGFRIRAVGGYDESMNAGAVKLRLDGTLGPVELFAMGGWNTNGSEPNNYARWSGDWALWVGGTFKMTEKATMNASANFDEGGDAEAALNMTYTIAPGFTVTPEINYRNHMDEKAGPNAKDWGGVIRLQRNF